ncbi:UDP-N-acetylmuramoyl-L-alanine--D-glutamate ligase [Gammaproteobacteria bacterium]|nr:UDP-N-acetylmuramoyl-L-alanine--D-glutamate ligase [Gammaproteobacteria bacterium]
MREKFYVILGLGLTGFSFANFLYKRNLPFVVIDTRENPPKLSDFIKLYPNIKIFLGGMHDDILDKATDIFISPGVSLKTKSISHQIKLGKSVIGDVELFSKEAKAPIIAITGTNAKSTVTTLVGEMAKNFGIKVKVGGNLGIPVLNLLGSDDVELYVLELSSFQLETVESLNAKIAIVLNVTPDHLDRYLDFNEYINVKRSIYKNCEIGIYNKDDLLVNGLNISTPKFNFTMFEPSENEFGIVVKNDKSYLSLFNEIILSIDMLPIQGKHFQANALAALAIGYASGFSMSSMIQTLKTFKGLPHRCELVREKNGIRWYNDSKGTNVGATIAAIDGLGCDLKPNIILIAGGVGKGADFSPLVDSVKKYIKFIVLIGEAASDLANTIGKCVKIEFANSMKEAVSLSSSIAVSGDSVVLSPACASFDMFNNFEHRGKVFSDLVVGL